MSARTLPDAARAALRALPADSDAARDLRAALAPRLTRARIAGDLAAHGRPQGDDVLAGMVLDLVRSGMSHGLAMDCAALVSDVRSGYSSHIKDGAGRIERAMRAEHAARHPNGKWARVYAKWGNVAYWMPDRDPRAETWANADYLTGGA